MKYPEEDIALELHREMVRRFTALSPTVDGAGVHWHCTVGRNDRECRINCFTLRNDREYYTSFKQESDTVAYSRISSSEETLEAVAGWLDGVDLPTLYARHEFIDANKRSLRRIQNDVIATEPDLKASAESELTQQYGDIYYLCFRGSNGRIRDLLGL